jgi:lysozyme family protein
MSFQECLDFVFRHEGGYVNDPRDPGGETKYGISKRAYPDLDIKALTPELAARIYRRDYWDTCRCDALPPGLALMVFDAAVNQGQGTAIRMLQAAASVPVDGRVGPMTIRAAGLDIGLPAFYSQRRERYEANKNFAIYGRGWIRRLDDCYALALKMAGRAG